MPQQYPARRTARPRPDASMSLLTGVMDHGLDAGYAEAAARRAALGQEPQRGARRGIWLATGLVLAALVVTVGAAEARVSAPVIAKEREDLIDRVEARTADADALHDDLDELRQDVAARQREALEESGGDRADLLALLAGATEVRGEGVELVIDDEGGSDTGRVRDRDMQRIVNGLWSAGAEAVAVNGQRLTALSAIRAAGEAILVDNRPLAPPYTVLAIGNGKSVLSGFRSSPDGHYLQALEDNYGVRAELSTQEELTLPAAPSLTLRTAEPQQKGTS